MRDYRELLEAANDLQDYQGYLGTEQLTERNKAQSRFDVARNKLVYALLQEAKPQFGGWRPIAASVGADFDRLAAAPGVYWPDAIAYAREEVLARLEREASKAPIVRHIARWTPLALMIALGIAYFTVRLTSALPVDRPVDTRAGLLQRAAVVAKAERYDYWNPSSGSRAELVANVLLWPIQPNADETRAAGELEALIINTYVQLAAKHEACALLSPEGAAGFGDQRVEMIHKVAEYLRRPDVQWKQPVSATIEPPIKAAFPCSELDVEAIRDLIGNETGK